MSRRTRIHSRRKPGSLPASATSLTATIIRCYRRTLRLTVEDASGVLDEGRTEPVVVALWHNRLLFMPACLSPELAGRFVVLISASRDGQYAVDLVRHFGLETVRGSSSNRGAAAVRALRRRAAEGQCPIVTLDGPRGPRYVPQPGAAFLAMTCNIPVVAASINARSRWELHSWDRMQIPKPFSKVTLKISPATPLATPGEKIDRTEALARLGRLMAAVTDDDRQ